MSPCGFLLCVRFLVSGTDCESAAVPKSKNACIINAFCVQPTVLSFFQPASIMIEVVSFSLFKRLRA